MATYHFSVKSKGKGYATQHYCYIARLMQYEQVRKNSHEVLEHVEPGRCMPSWVKDPIEFWSAADTYERANAKVYMEYEIALPNEFTPEQRKTLVETFLEQHVAKQQFPHSYAIHNVKSRLSGEDQPHCHLMFSLKVDDGLERTAEQYFKRYNAKDPAQGGVKKIQLQNGHQNYSEFLLFIRKAWENHLNDALAQHCPTVTYHIDGQDITIKNQVSAGSYDQYNELHGTIYIAEPKLGAGKQNETAEYLSKIQKIRIHNAKERELEQKQQQLDQQHDHFYSCMSEPYPSLEVIYYMNHLAKKAKNQNELKKDILDIEQDLKPVFQQEQLNIHRINYELINSLQYPEPAFEFKITPQTERPEVDSAQVQTQKPIVPEQISKLAQQKPRNDDYDFGEP